MPHLNMEQLKTLRDEARQAQARSDAEAAEIVIGLGTCGIAAGAQTTLEAFRDELDKSRLDTVKIRQTGCMGLCYSEPTVEVAVPGMPRIVYGNVDAETARRIVRKHIMGKLLINDHIYDKPAADIVRA